MKNATVALVIVAAVLFALLLKLPTSPSRAIRHQQGDNVSFLDVEPIVAPRGLLIWYVRNQVTHLSWVDRHLFFWDLLDSRAVPDPPPSEPVSWSAWNPTESWGLYYGQASPEITSISVNEQPAQLHRDSGLWFFFSASEPAAPPVRLTATDKNGTAVWQYPLPQN